MSAPGSRLLHTLRTPHLTIAQCLGLGLIPVAPGTFGTLAGFAMFAGFSLFDVSIRAIAYVVLFACAVWAVRRAGDELGEHDHQSIVIDEMFAMCLVLEVAPQTAPGWLAAFVLFRLFDIWKPWPINVVDRQFETAFGVMLDDLLAAVFSGLVLIGLHSTGAL